MQPGQRTILALAFVSLSATVRASAPALPPLRQTSDAEILEGSAARPTADFGLPDIDLFLRAGRSVPPGLTATRARERERERASALELLGLQLAPASEQREAWISAIDSILASRAARAGIWTAAAGVVGELGLYELDSHLVAGLEPGAPAFVRLAAAQALAHLYGVRPDEGVEFQRPFEPGPGTRYLLGLLREREASELAVRKELFTVDVERALSALADGDPAVRRVAAGVLRTAAAEGRVDTERLRAALRQALESEASAHAFHAELEALLAVSTGLAPDSPEVAGLRGFLLRLSGEAPGSFLLSLANGLSRLPWTEGPERPQINLRAAERNLANLLRRVASDPYGDADVTSGVLASLEDLLSRVEGVAGESSTEDGSWVRGAAAREPLLALLASPRVPDSVRRRAAETLSRVALGDDVQLLLEVLDSEDASAGLRYVLLGTLANLTEELDGDAGTIVDRLFEFLDDPDADLRRRALSLLASPGFGEYVKRADLARIVDRLEVEPVQELKSGLLALLRRHGGPELLDPLLEHASFDHLAVGTPARTAELADTLEQLAAGDPDALMRSARRLAAVPDESTRLARLLRCLQLVGDLDEDAARALAPEDHRRIVSWARAVRSAGVPLQDALPGGDRFLARLVEVHLPAIVPSSSMSEAERAHSRALFLSDLVALGATEREGEAFAQFASALEAAQRNAEPFFAARVRRDRARFALARGQKAAALADLSVLLDDEACRDVLELADLRTLASLLSQVPAINGGPPAELEAFSVLLGLVHQPSWRNEPGAVRLRDLTDLADRAQATADPTNVAAVLALLADLPAGETPAAPGTTAPPRDDLPVWDGLDREPALLGQLRELVARLRPAAGEPAGTPGAEDETGAKDGRGESTSETRPRR